MDIIAKRGNIYSLKGKKFIVCENGWYNNKICGYLASSDDIDRLTEDFSITSFDLIRRSNVDIVAKGGSYGDEMFSVKIAKKRISKEERQEIRTDEYVSSIHRI